MRVTENTRILLLYRREQRTMNRAGYFKLHVPDILIGEKISDVKIGFTGHNIYYKPEAV